MASVLNSSVWRQLHAHYQQHKTTHMRELFDHDPTRFERFSVHDCGLLLDYSKNRITPEILSTLLQLAETSHLRQKIQAMFQGQYINTTEHRQVQHIALRTDSNHDNLDANRQLEIDATKKKMFEWVEQLHQGKWKGATGKPITDFVSIGIGGSFLGPKIISEALKPYWQTSIRGHFVANIDGMALQTKLAQLNPETTLFIVASKSFTTQETLTNALSARHWLEQHGINHQISQHFIAISANVEKATAFGISPAHILPMWDWVGGRYSLWSAIGLPIALLIGQQNFSDLLAGAAEMDHHFYQTPWNQNMSVILALLGIWYINFFNTQTHALLCYDHLLRGLPAYIQQLDMESNGKAVNHNGEPVDVATAPITWGGEGTNGQHAFHQLLHQSQLTVPVDFILPLTSHAAMSDHHKILAANCFGQSQALMQGCTYEEAYKTIASSDAARLAPHKVMPGNKPSNTILMEKITPNTLGSLIAMYEHKTFVQGHIWGINSFDQWGVELGKSLGKGILKQLSKDVKLDGQDSSTQGLVQHFHRQSLS
jgi:glucose-6-phosphate isomerase